MAIALPRPALFRVRGRGREEDGQNFDIRSRESIGRKFQINPLNRVSRIIFSTTIFQGAQNWCKTSESNPLESATNPPPNWFPTVRARCRQFPTRVSKIKPALGGESGPLIITGSSGPSFLWNPHYHHHHHPRPLVSQSATPDNRYTVSSFSNLTTIVSYTPPPPSPSFPRSTTRVSRHLLPSLIDNSFRRSFLALTSMHRNVGGRVKKKNDGEKERERERGKLEISFVSTIPWIFRYRLFIKKKRNKEKFLI